MTERRTLGMILRAIWQWARVPYIWVHWCGECGRRFIALNRDEGFCSEDCAGAFWCGPDVYNEGNWDIEEDFYVDDDLEFAIW